ncbi:hypothetical protein SK128_008132, partial [Halocaridina rubra]
MRIVYSGSLHIVYYIWILAYVSCAECNDEVDNTNITFSRRVNGFFRDLADRFVGWTRLFVPEEKSTEPERRLHERLGKLSPTISTENPVPLTLQRMLKLQRNLMFPDDHRTTDDVMELDTSAAPTTDIVFQDTTDHPSMEGNMNAILTADAAFILALPLMMTFPEEGDNEAADTKHGIQTDFESPTRQRLPVQNHEDETASETGKNLTHLSSLKVNAHRGDVIEDTTTIAHFYSQVMNNSSDEFKGGRTELGIMSETPPSFVKIMSTEIADSRDEYIQTEEDNRRLLCFFILSMM